MKKLSLYEMLKEDDAMTGGPEADREKRALALIDEARDLISQSKYSHASDACKRAAQLLAQVAFNKIELKSPI